MTTGTTAPANGTSGDHKAPALALAVTDRLAPKTWIALVSILVGWHADRWLGIVWGLVGVLFAAVIPLLMIRYGIRRGRWADRHLNEKKARLFMMPLFVLSVAVGIGLMITLNAPQAMVALVAAMLITLALLTAITPVWKISVHAAVAAGTVMMLVLTYGPWWLFGFAVVALVCWSRIMLRHHTSAQVIAGAIAGAIVAGAAFELIR